MISKSLAFYILISLTVVVLNVSVNFFDPFKGGLGVYSTAMGSSTTSLWAYLIVGIDALYVFFSIRTFRILEKK